MKLTKWADRSWVSIRTRPEGRVMPACVDERGSEWLVSIRTRPEGRVMQRLRPAWTSDAELVSIRTRPEGRVMLLFENFHRLLRPRIPSQASVTTSPPIL